MGDAKKTSSYLQAGPAGLGNLLSKVKEWNLINEQLATVIEPALWKYCRAGSIASGQLTILAANGSIASQLRFQTADILLKFKAHPQLHMITGIHCKVIPSFAYTANNLNLPAVKSKNLLPLSQDTATVLKEIAEGIEDNNLRDAMLRIAAHVRKVDVL